MQFHFFHVEVAALTIVPVMSVVFMALAIIPSIALLEVGLRGKLSLRLMGLFSMNSLEIGLTSVTVWFINLIIPAIIFFQAEDGIRHIGVTGVQTCALPICGEAIIALIWATSSATALRARSAIAARSVASLAAATAGSRAMPSPRPR